MSKPLLEISNMSAGYHGRAVLHDVTFRVDPGELLLLVGPNGHGKSTLLRTISGLNRPMHGDIRLDGRSIVGVAPEHIARGGCIHVPQGDLLFSDMSVLDNLLMGLHCAPHGERAARLDEIFAIIPKLKARLHQIARTLSGGERRMLALARGLVAKGRLLLIDEPSLGLAPIVIDQIYDVLIQLKDAGRTILLVEENVERGGEIADRIVLLDNGRIAWTGGADEPGRWDVLLNTYLGA